MLGLHYFFHPAKNRLVEVIPGGQTDPEKFKPFGIGYVELPGETKVETRLTESDPTKLAEGMEMELTLEPVGKDEDGNDIVTYAFKPI